MRLISFRSLITVFCILWTAQCVLTAFNAGKNQHLDGAVNYGAIVDIWAIGIAISQGAYGFYEGYVGRPEVVQALADHIAPEGLYALSDRQQALAGSKEAIERGIQAAIALDPAKMMPYEGTVRAPFAIIPGDDTGIVDYYRLAFFLFGYHADSSYKLYFTLFAFSCAMFAAQFRRQAWPMISMGMIALGFVLMFTMDIFWTGVPSVSSNRFMATLTLLATLHMLLLAGKPPTNRAGWIMAGGQLLLLSFVISMRGSAMWEYLLILGWIGAYLLWHVIRRMRPFKVTTLPRWLWTQQRHCVLLLAMVIALHAGYQSIRLLSHNKVYFSECATPNHFTWHSAYIGLTRSPYWTKVVPPETQGVFGGDGMAWKVAETYWQRKNPGSPYFCERLGFYLFGYHDSLMREAYFDFAIKHPGYMFDLMLYYKPILLASIIKKNALNTPPVYYWLLGVIATIGLFAGYSAGKRNSYCTREAVLCVGAVVAMALMSNLPHLFAYPSYLFETVWLLLSLVALISAFICSWLGYRLARLNTK